VGSRQLFDNAQWIAWLASTAAACIALSSFSFTFFESKTDAKDKQERDQASLLEIKQSIQIMQSSMDRVEQKVDFLDGKISGGR